MWQYSGFKEEIREASASVKCHKIPNASSTLLHGKDVKDGRMLGSLQKKKFQWV